ncbi:MAG TPA: hypothetical protein VK832_05835, partial [Burkholderiaceae bacterium]|nr:hypothetical protein [Burkholderiaceae bacterium]
ALGDAYDNAASKSQDALSILGGVGAIGGLVTAFAAVLDYVGNVNSQLANMATVANQVGLSLKDFQSISFGGAMAGLSTDQINDGLQKSATLLNDASRNSNSLSKELDANGISVKNANGQLISQNQLLTIAAGLVSNAKSPGDEAAIASMLGFTKEWIPLLEQGSAALTALGPAAQSAGAIIDDSTIQRATDFDTQWRQSSVQWSTNMKAAVADILPYIDDLITSATKFMSSIKLSDVQAASDQSFKDFNEQTGIPDTGVVKIDAMGCRLRRKSFRTRRYSRLIHGSISVKRFTKASRSCRRKPQIVRFPAIRRVS